LEVLTKAGLSVNEAKVLSYLFKKKEATARELEQNMRMRQPEVSIATTKLFNKSLIDRRVIKTGGKGRPRHVYVVKNEAIDILKGWVANKIEELEDTLKELDRMRVET